MPHLQKHSSPCRLSPARIALLYVITGSVWILCTDAVTAGIVRDVQSYSHLSVVKGWLFVVCSTGVIYLLTRRYAREMRMSLRRYRAARLQARQEIRQLIHYDQETGLPNQNLLMDRFQQVIARNNREHSRTAVIYISLTGFKTLVDSWGLQAVGDVMRVVADRIVTTLRQFDTVARINRDEFVIVPGNSVQETDLPGVLQKLQQIFAVPLEHNGREFVLPASMGVACYPDDGLTAELLLNNAHIAMNQARQERLPYRFFSTAMNRKALERSCIEDGIMRAMGNGEFFICYQPKFLVDSGEVVGMEALLRWNKPDMGVVPPARFIQVAEDNGMIVQLGEWVLRTVCAQCMQWQELGYRKLQVSVNISTRQLRDSQFVDMVRDALAVSGLDPHFLELEITESAMIEAPEETIYKLLKLREAGISVSIDDFGTGYASLSYLKHLPADKLKIDRSFIREVVSSPGDAAIVDAIIAMAHALKLTVIAEGVETMEQLEYLKQHRCHQVQGYFFAQPLVPHHFEYFLRTGTAAVAVSGELTLVFNDDMTSFNGTWNYGGQHDWDNVWSGSLDERSGGTGGLKVYRTTYGTMSLLFDGPAVTGSYTHNDGRIEGVMEGTTLTGTWRQGAKTQYVAPVRLDSGVQAITGLGGGEPPLQVWGGFGMHREEKEKGDSSLQEMLPGRECGRIDRIRDVAVTPVPVAPGDTIPTVLNRFQSDPELLVLPVVERQKVQGVINRYIFFEEHVIGRYGFGFHINHSKKIRDLMSPVALLIEGDTSFEDAVRQIQAAGQNLQRLDNICVLDGGDYAGVVDVNRFIVAMTEINLVLAKGANPLTGLPGNESIQREINNRLSKGRTFDIAYIDIDNFKPYNDYYGFQKGDVVIKALGEVITAALKSPAADGSFCGHIGGDDFIVITGAHRGEIVAESVIQGFGEHLPVFHGAEDFNAGCYTTLNRKGLRETFPLLSLSIGIVSTALTPVESYAQLASLSTDVKRAAKKLSGSAVVVNRRHLPGVLPGQEGCFGHNDMLVAQEAKRADHSSNSMREKYSP